ncbi:MAG: dephospho-CoA kinase [Candidatus Cloacimonetes bacterium]|nr:dephospho-CoA kinase [Candidatus Cloacimonadota bacterium]
MLQNKRPFLIGITGNIGSGKSSFCRALVSNGLTVFSADNIARQRLYSPEVKQKLIERYSTSITGEFADGITIDNAKLANIVFSDPAEIEFLNSLLHPLVLKDLQDIVDKCTEPVLCFEIPLLIEANLQDCFDYIVMISIPENLRISRLRERGETPEMIKMRLQNQLGDSVKQDRVDYCIDNSHSKEQLETTAKHFIETIPNLPKRTVKPFISIKN